jgi:hypothetical protein
MPASGREVAAPRVFNGIFMTKPLVADLSANELCMAAAIF